MGLYFPAGTLDLFEACTSTPVWIFIGIEFDLIAAPTMGESSVKWDFMCVELPQL